ncbi:MAG TPA: LemA family protein [Candidatus Izemoplasmatales bacterium]|nr:LemA family protein [Bacillota bacterium]HRY78287.1 LemA family protein [Candidatus Izemoplasmatales bacterium]
MKKPVIIVLASIGVLILTLGIILISGYNKLVSYDEKIGYEYSIIDSRLEMRYNTLTQLANAINGFQAHEQAYFEAITNARAAYAAAKANNDLEGMIAADNLSSIAMADLLALFEDNEPLQAMEAYEDFNDAVWGIESALSEARRQYNYSVMDYNKLVRQFPGVLYKSMFNFPASQEYWKPAEGTTQIPDITFGGNTGE